ncbi:MAG TPA: FliM/FliN family flagellar motor C-terminal domain-containing protein [Terriglobales bacterium]|jgi:flagellar motor switch/type III secretory pathway protein FliN
MDAAVQRAKEQPNTTGDQSVVLPVSPKVMVERFGWLGCELSLEISIDKFKIGDLIKLGKGSLVETGCHYTSDIPLRANGLLIGWTEFEVIGSRLAVRITELA